MPQHDKVQALIQSAFTSDRPLVEQEPSRRTILINTSLMWEILDYTFPGKSPHSAGHELFHESLCRNADADNGKGDTVETRIFHSSTREPDTSDGGQALPPYADHPVNRNANHSSGNASRQGEVIDSSTAEKGQMQYAPLTEVSNSPWTFPGNPSIMDITRDPFFQFQDQGSPFFGFWEVGNL